MKAEKIIVTIVRWIAFLPIGLAAMWVASRISLFIMSNQISFGGPGISPLVASITLNVIGGSALGFVGTVVSPRKGWIPTVTLAGTSIIIGIVYAAFHSHWITTVGAFLMVLSTLVSSLWASQEYR